MNLYRFDPLTDPRWPGFLEDHPRASVFHGTKWLESVRQTYGHEPIAYSTCHSSENLTNGVVFCRINSRLTGCRLVGLPFADHCEPLVNDSAKPDELSCMLEQVLKDAVNDGVTHLELRPTRSERWKATKATTSEDFVLHTLDLRPPLETIYQGMHRSTIQRKILRAERERLNFESGNTETLLNVFYPLQVMTRKRHGWPPQPIQWFRNLRQAMGESLQISIARKDRRQSQRF
jgi:hypothetical protein